MNLRILAVALLIGCAGLFIRFYSDVATPLNRPFSEFPAAVDQWRAVRDWRFSDRTLEVLQPSDYLARKYAGPEGKAVELYIGYHDGGPEAGAIHSPKNCLPGSGWYLESEKQRRIPVQGRELEVVSAVYRRGEKRTVFYYWFQVCGRPVTNEYALKMGEILGSVTSRRRDTAFVRISADGRGEVAESAVTRFVSDFYPTIQSFLPS